VRGTYVPPLLSPPSNRWRGHEAGPQAMLPGGMPSAPPGQHGRSRLRTTPRSVPVYCTLVQLGAAAGALCGAPACRPPFGLVWVCRDARAMCAASGAGRCLPLPPLVRGAVCACAPLAACTRGQQAPVLPDASLPIARRLRTCSQCRGSLRHARQASVAAQFFVSPAAARVLPRRSPRACCCARCPCMLLSLLRSSCCCTCCSRASIQVALGAAVFGVRAAAACSAL
jgi:hypothetical protein